MLSPIFQLTLSLIHCCFSHGLKLLELHCCCKQPMFPCCKIAIWGSNVSLNMFALFRCLTALFKYLLPPWLFGHPLKEKTRSHVHPPPKNASQLGQSSNALSPWKLKEHRVACFSSHCKQYNLFSFRSPATAPILHACLLSFSPTSSIFFYSACQIKMQSKQLDCQTSYSPFYVSI